MSTKYELKNGNILKDGYTMFLEDVVMDLNSNYATAKKHRDFVEKLSIHQCEEDSDLLTIGELTLTELDMWM